MCRSKLANAKKGVSMNNIKNYGMTNYQIGFQARNAKKAVKGLKPISEWVTKDGKKFLEMNDAAVVDKQYKPSIQQFKTVKQKEPFAYYQEHSNGELSELANEELLSELANQIPSVKIKMLIESFKAKVLSALGL